MKYTLLGTLLHIGGGRNICELFPPLTCPREAQENIVSCYLELLSYGGGPPLLLGKSGNRLVRCTYGLLGYNERPVGKFYSTYLISR